MVLSKGKVNMNEIKCIFCGIGSDNVVINENGYTGRKCSRCGLIYISPRPSFDNIVDLYALDNAHLSAQSHISSNFLKRLYARHNLNIIQSFVKSGSLLELGAGAGYFLDEARKIGFIPQGVEFNSILANYIRNTLKIPCEESLLNTPVFKGKQFDVVYHCDVVSHLYDPISDFKKINEMMKDNAFLIFETGNFGEIDQVYFKHIERFQYPEHLFLFSTDNLIDLLNKTGFKFMKMYKYSILPQLLATKALAGAKNLIKKCILESKENEERVETYKTTVKEGIRNINYYCNYLLRYKVGSIIPKAHRPQTVIVVAKKSK